MFFFYRCCQTNCIIGKFPGMDTIVRRGEGKAALISWKYSTLSYGMYVNFLFFPPRIPDQKRVSGSTLEFKQINRSKKTA